MQSFLNEFKKFNIYQDKNYLKLNSLKICKNFLYLIIITI